MADPSLPPWMQQNPLAGVPLFLSGFGTGVQAGASRRQGEQQAYEAELQHQAAQERSELLREARAIQAQEFAEGLKLRQETAKRAAAESAIQIEGQQGFEKEMQGLVGQGIAPDEAYRQVLPKWAPKLFFKHEQSLADVMKGLAAPKDKMPQAGTVGGRNVIYGAGGQWRFNEPAPTSVEAVPITDPDGKLLGYGRPGPGGTIIPMPPPRAAKRNPMQTVLDKSRAELADVMADPMNIKQGFQGPGVRARIAELQKIVAEGEGGIVAPNAAPAADATVQPLPAKKEQLVNGQIYQTTRGPAVWNGTAFDAVPER